MPEASSPPRAPTPLLKLRRQKAGKNQKLQHQRRTKRYKRLGFQQSVPGVREVRRAVEDVREERAAHGVVPVLRYPSDLAARLWLEKPQADSVLGRVFRDSELRQGGPRKTGRVEPDGADPAQPNRHSRAGLPRGHVATPLLQRVRRGRQAPPSPLRARWRAAAVAMRACRQVPPPCHTGAKTGQPQPRGRVSRSRRAPARLARRRARDPHRWSAARSPAPAVTVPCLDEPRLPAP